MEWGKVPRRIRATLAGAVLLLGLSVAHAAESSLPTLTFPQLAAGDGIAMELNLANPGTRLETGVVLFKKEDGSALELLVNGISTSRLDFSIKPGGVLKIRPGAKNLVVGYALVVADSLKSGLVGNAIFTVAGVFDVSIPDSQPTTRATLFVEKEASAAIDSGIALLNPGSAPITLTLALIDSGGQEVDDAQIVLAAGQKISKSISDLFYGLGHFTGSVRISSGSPFHALGLRQRGSGSLASLPAASVAAPEAGSQLLYFIDSGINLDSQGISAGDLQEKTVWQLTGQSKAVNKTLLRLTNTHRSQAVTLHFYYLNDQCRDFFDFLVVIPCGEALVFDPFDFPIPTTEWRTSNILFGKGLSEEMAKSFPASQFGSGRFILSVVAVGVSLDANDTAEILYPNEMADTGKCGVTPLNTGSKGGFERENLHVYNARPMVFDYLSGAHAGASASCDGALRSADAQLEQLSAFTRKLVPATFGNGFVTLPTPLSAALFAYLEKQTALASDGKPLPVTFLFAWGSESFRILEGTR
jgi:hypothetical protein